MNAKDLLENEFVNGIMKYLNSKLLDNNNSITTQLRYTDNVGFYIDKILLGVLDYEDLKNRSDMCYFKPTAELFDYIEFYEIDKFIRVSNQLTFHFSEFFLSDNPNKMRDKRLNDFGFHLKGKDNYYKIKMDTDYRIKENSSIVFKVVKNFNDFNVYVDYQFNISCHDCKDYSVVHPQMKITLSMKDNIFTLTHQYDNYFPILHFGFNSIPDFHAFTDQLVDYTLMSSYGIELPTLEDFQLNRKMYKEIISMAIIS